jgi:hypothetical protein
LSTVHIYPIIMPPKSPIFQRFIKSHTKLSRAVEDTLQVPSRNILQQQQQQQQIQRQRKRFWKGVGHDGNFYRLPIPPSTAPRHQLQQHQISNNKARLPDIPKLPKSTPMPMPLTPPPKPPETVEQIKCYRRQFGQWLVDNFPIMILNVGSLCTLLAFTRTDVLELRSLAITGQICFVAFQLQQHIILWPSVMWSSLFATVNAYKVHGIWEERHSFVRMTHEQERVFVDFFMPHGVTPKQFERIDERAQCFKLKKGQVLIRKGDKLNN